MRKICMIIGYDGTDFHGFQRQPGLRTVQGVLEKLLKTICKEPIVVYGAGRTDAGVHALGQVCHFITNSSISGDKFRYIVNRIGPRDIVVSKSIEVDLDFHAQKDASYKTYCYDIRTSRIASVRSYRYEYHYSLPLDIDAMQRAAAVLQGTHDYTSFCSPKTHVDSKVRTVYSLVVEESPHKISLRVTGNGFIYHMVRIFAGTLVSVGRYKMTVGDVSAALSGKDRVLAGPTLPANGLTLMKVGYEEWGETGP